MPRTRATSKEAGAQHSDRLDAGPAGRYPTLAAPSPAQGILETWADYLCARARAEASMAWTEPVHSKRQIDRAGEDLVRGDVLDEDRKSAAAVVANWRSSHAFPLNTLQMNLRQQAKKVEAAALVAQRLKRAHSIEFKLRRFPGMRLSRMQDLGGARAVMSTVPAVRSLLAGFDRSRSLHERVREDDYIETPKDSGYRSVHRVYRYRSNYANQQQWDGLLIELQFRSKLQHAWATAVETVGTFLDQSLKSSQGSGDWLHLFKNISSAFAAREGCPAVPGTYEGAELLAFVRDESRRLGIAKKLNQFRAALRHASSVERSKKTLFLMQLSADGTQLYLESFPSMAVATDRYAEVERRVETEGGDAVLVRATSLDALRAAYPNYFLDTEQFLSELDGLSAARSGRRRA